MTGAQTQPNAVPPVPAEPGEAPVQSPPVSTSDRRVWWLAGGAAVAIAVLAGLVGGEIGSRTNTSVTNGTAFAAAVGSCPAVSVADKVLPAIVTISARNGTNACTGSGEVIRDDGYIVTNYHVIAPAGAGGALSALLNDGETYQARLVGSDPRSDLAVLKVTSAKKLRTIAIGSSKTLIVGQPVVALGAPLGLSGTVTVGIISALGRNVPVPLTGGKTAVLAGAVQTDASINPGNSGGALVDCQGRLIGVNSAIATVPNASGQASGGSVGIGFAIPVDVATLIANEIISTGQASHADFGGSVALIPPQLAGRSGVPSGVYVQSIVAGGPLDKAGIRTGDVITEINGAPADSAETLAVFAITKRAGDKVDVKCVRDGETISTTVTLK